VRRERSWIGTREEYERVVGLENRCIGDARSHLVRGRGGDNESFKKNGW